MDDNTSNDGSQERGFGAVEEREVPEDQMETTDEGGEQSITTDNQPTETTDQAQGNQGVGDTQTTLTEKGTKLDPNPQSAVHQQLANERRLRSQMEQVLADPTKLAQFMQKQYGITIPQQKENGQPSNTVKKYTAQDFENLDQVAEKFNSLQEMFTSQLSAKDKEIQVLKEQVGGIQGRSHLEAIASRTESDVKDLQAEPELNPKSPDFIPGLEQNIIALYQNLDFDEQSGLYKGQYSLKQVAQHLIGAARTARKSGVEKGQTIIKDKTPGAVRTSSGSTTKTVNRDEMSPGASIAQGIAEMFKR